MNVVLKKQVYKIEIEVSNEELEEIIGALEYNEGITNVAINTEATEDLLNNLSSIHRDANQVEDWQREGK